MFEGAEEPSETDDTASRSRSSSDRGRRTYVVANHFTFILQKVNEFGHAHGTTLKDDLLQFLRTIGQQSGEKANGRSSKVEIRFLGVRCQCRDKHSSTADSAYLDKLESGVDMSFVLDVQF